MTLEKNGSANILKIATLSIVIILAFTGYLVATDLNSRQRDTTIQKEHQEDVDALREKIHTNQITMIREQTTMSNTLTRIATKLDV